jgi:phosphoenolpyruvate synthase/pyruvate phosphate dikinase
VAKCCIPFEEVGLDDVGHGRPIGLCGRAPSDDPEFARVLLEQGIDSLSVNPDAVLRVWQSTKR